jgi:hypothetical protein
MSYIEITVRTFFTSDEADITPRVAVLVEQDKIGLTDWKDVVVSLRKLTMDNLEGATVTNVREMTLEEIRAYREAESD